MRRLVEKNREILVFKNIEEISDFVIKKWIELSKEAFAKERIFTVAISGGRTPAIFYRKLSQVKDFIDWNKIHLFIVDERFVPFDDSESNYKMIKENLLDSINIPNENIHSISIEESVERSAKNYEKDLIQFFSLRGGELPKFDLLILGVGEDGHTASLFPESKSLYEKKQLVVSVNQNEAKHSRITLTLAVINSGRNIIFLVSGWNKRVVLKKILEDNNNLPAALIKPEKGKISFLIDVQASELLQDILK